MDEFLIPKLFSNGGCRNTELRGVGFVELHVTNVDRGLVACAISTRSVACREP